MMGEFRYLTAKEWGMTWKRPPVGERKPDKEVYVHHNAGSRRSKDAATAFRAMNKSAQDSRDYSAVAYDILVHRNVDTGLVTIGEGRGPWLSAATKNRNEEGEAICLLGYFHPGHSLSEKPHPDEIEGIALGIVWGIEQGWISRDANILGHRDNPEHPNATVCPGDYLYSQLGTIRDRVKSLLDGDTYVPLPIVEGEDMKYLSEPVRIYDSRVDGQAVSAGEVRKIKVGNITKTHVNITCVNENSGSGYASIAGTSKGLHRTSIINFDGAAGRQVRCNSASLGVPDGHIYFTSTTPCHVIVDVFAQG